MGESFVEVHISNIHARDELHRHSKVSAAATAVICGLGPYGYIAGDGCGGADEEGPRLNRNG